MTDIQALRQKAIAESESVSKKSRFGLFSHPLTTAVGDNGPYKSKLHARDEQGKPIVSPRNFQVSPNKSGQGDSTFFGKLNSLAASQVKDIYVQPGKRLLIEEKQRYQSGLKPDQPAFKFGATGIRTLTSSTYEYQQQKTLEKDSKRFRQEDGGVKVGPRNFYSNSQKKVISSFFKPFEYQPDPYDRAHKLELQKQKKNKSMQPEASFKPNSFIPQKFSSDSQIYNIDIQMKMQTKKEAKFNVFAHEKQWKSSSPNKSGLYGYFEPFPKYMENPKPESKRKSLDPNAKPSFKSMNHTSSSQPSPSVSNNTVNLRKIATIALRH